MFRKSHNVPYPTPVQRQPYAQRCATANNRIYNGKRAIVHHYARPIPQSGCNDSHNRTCTRIVVKRTPYSVHMSRFPGKTGIGTSHRKEPSHEKRDVHTRGTRTTLPPRRGPRSKGHADCLLARIQKGMHETLPCRGTPRRHLRVRGHPTPRTTAPYGTADDRSSPILGQFHQRYR